MLYYISFYGLKSFLQIQFKSKIASLLCDGVPMLVVLDKSKFVKFLFSFWQYGIAFVNQLCDHHGAVFDWYIFKQWKRLDLRSSVLEWFKLSTTFLNDVILSLTYSLAVYDGSSSDILGSSDFVSVCDHFLQVDNGILFVYTDRSLKNLGTASCRAGAVTFFENIGLGLSVGVLDLMSSTLAKLQAIALALECVLLSSSINLFLDSQSALDAYKSELGLMCSDFCNQCWVECQHIVNVICNKNLRVSWHKVKGHSGVLENEHADIITGAAFLLGWCFPSHLDEHFIVSDYSIVSGNSRHFIHLLLIWHSNLHMATGFTSRSSANAHTRLYFSMLCLYCDKVEVSDYAFSCKKTLLGFAHFSSCVLQLLLSCSFDFSVSMALFKAVSIFHNPKIASVEVVKFNDLILLNGSTLVPVSGLASGFSAGVLKLFGIIDAFGVSGLVSIHIAA
ncbi:hypothetical protein G9A89_010357 [Geosiphon pyriformis]|nr:hypothetical protein G9A89_010357 [Geosiphon pyriformis]